MSHYVCTSIKTDENGHVRAAQCMRVNIDERQFYEAELETKRHFGAGDPDENPYLVDTWRRPWWWQRLLGRAGQ